MIAHGEDEDCRCMKNLEMARSGSDAGAILGTFSKDLFRTVREKRPLQNGYR